MQRKYEDSETSELLSLATIDILDPCFKMDYVDEEVQEHVKERIISEGSMFARPIPSDSAALSTDTDSSEPAPPNKKKKLGSLFKKTRMDSPTTLTPKERAKVELTMYLQSSQPDTESDPLAWWQPQEQNLPILSKLARKYVYVPLVQPQRGCSVQVIMWLCQRGLASN